MRTKLRTVLAAGLVAGLGLSVTSSAGPKKARATKRRALPTAKRHAGVVKCAEGTPTKHQCLTPTYTTVCKQHRTACKPHFEAAMKEHHKSSAYKSAPTKRMMRPNRTAMPKNLTDGKFHRFRPDAQEKKGFIGKKKFTSNNLFDRSNLNGAPRFGVSVNTAKNAHRNPAWDANGATVASCQEYAYEQVYDWVQFTDAAAACRGDRNCYLDIAFLKSNPGLSSRVLKRSDGRPMETQYVLHKKAKGGKKWPKNVIFDLLPHLVYSAGPAMKEGDPKFLPETQELKDLEDVMKTGGHYYKWHCKGGCSNKEFKNDWDFHEKMFNRNRTVSDAEFEEYDRRKREFLRLSEEWQYAVRKEKEKALGPRKVRQHYIMERFDAVIDPWEHQIQQQRLLRGTNKVRGGMKLKTFPKLDKTRGQVRGALELPDLIPAAGVLAAPMPRKARPTGRAGVKKLPRGRGVAKPKPKAKPTVRPGKAGTNKAGPAKKKAKKKSKGGKRNRKGASPRTDFSDLDHLTKDMCKAWGNADSGAELMGYGPHSCRLGVFIRNEYRRIAKGEYSCLDLSSDDCDWSPLVFEQQFIEGVPYLDEQQHHLNECDDWSPNLPKGLKAAEDEIAKTKKDAAEAWAKLGPYQQRNKTTNKIVKVGRTFSEKGQWGSKKWLAAGYNAGIGWGVKPIKRTGGGKVCQLAGDAHAKLGASAWLLGGKYRILAANADARVNYSPGQVKTTYGLTILNKVIAAENVTFNLSFGPKRESRNMWKYPSPRPQWTFMAGPIPITGSVWAELNYGYEFDMQAKLESQNCDMANIEFGLESTLTPMVMLSAVGQVGVGISGIASAGVRGLVNLVTFGFPFTTGLMAKKNANKTDLEFSLELGMLLSSLSGKLMLYVEFLFFEETWTLFRWSGIRHNVDLMEPLKVTLPLVGWPK